MADLKNSSLEHEASSSSVYETSVCSNDEASSSSEHETSVCSNDDMTSLIGNVISESMVKEEKLLEKDAIQAERDLKDEMMTKEKVMEEEQCYKRLNLLLSRSSIYAQFMAEKLQRDKLKEARKQLRAEKSQGSKRKKVSVNTPSKKSVLTTAKAFKKGGNQNYESDDFCNSTVFNNTTESQPTLLTGAVMHPYQIEGFEWLKVLFENGVNGILADEMGLGKTIQTIAFIAYLIEMGISGPFFICGPLSTVPNWHSEFRRFAPSIPVMVYHGNKVDRQEMRKKFNKKVNNRDVSCYPVIITSYQIALVDAKFLAMHEWTLLVVDEAHRIKNYQCKLVLALKTLSTSHRLLLTGTPLQNNLSELWSLLNFILPEIFDDLKVFESWFDITRIAENGGTNEIVAQEQEKQIVSIIHQILTPFLLRRTKTEVQLELPPKKELIVHAPLTKKQQEYYTAVLNKSIENVVNGSRGHYFDVKIMDSNQSRKRNMVDYNHIYKMLDDKKFEYNPECVEKTVSDSSKQDFFDDLAHVQLNMRNTCMLLRKICGHPYLVSYPLDSKTGEHKIDEGLIFNSGKLLVLDLMLPELKKRGHKILLFSQFVTMLEVLGDYCMYRKYNYNFLCGSMTLAEREEEIKSFNESKDSFIFLISTKAGGLGLNLAAADTVILYDTDWNPQGDLQAQDRCHRIGQNKPVIVYRLIIPNTVDQRMFERANAKRKLEKVIIKKGRFNSKEMKSSDLSIEELIELLQSSDSTGFVKTDDNCVLSPEELNRILDRSNMI